MWVPHPLKSVAAASPLHEALVFESQSMTYAEMHKAVMACASWFSLHGVKEGHRVALTGPLSLHWVVAFHAVGWLGAAVVPVPGYVSDVEGYLGDMHADSVWDVSSPGWLGHMGACLESVRWSLDSVRCVLKTSGTTGPGAVVCITTAQTLMGVLGTLMRIGHDPSDRWLLCVPHAHVASFSVLMRALWGGATVLLHASFDANAVNHALDHGGVTRVSMVPAMLERVLDARDGNPFASGVRTVLLGGAAASSQLLQRCVQSRVPVVVTWGMTETSGTVTLASVEASWQEGCVGVPHVFAEVVSEDGVLCVQGPTAPEGGYTTSDRGYSDPSGKVYVQGRKDDVCVSGGYKIMPQDVEACVRDTGFVRDVCVVGKPSVRWGERLVAYVVPREGFGCDEKALVDACRQTMPSFKIPDVWVWCDVLPRNPSGKVLRRVLREHVQSGKPVYEMGGNAAFCECVWIDETMYKAHSCAQHTLAVVEGVLKRDGVGTDAQHLDADGEDVSHAHGVGVVGFAVHQGRGPLALGESTLGVSEHGGNQFFKSVVAVRVKSSEKNNACAVNVVKAGSDTVFEGHGSLVHPMRVVGG